jgi:hypothetical protein
MLREGMFKEAVQALQRDPANGWTFLHDVVRENGAIVVDIGVSFLNGVMPADSIDRVKGGDAFMQQEQRGSRAAMGFRLDASTVAPEVHPQAQHEEILKIVGVGNDLGAQTVPVADLGNHAQVLTIVGYHVG